MAFPYSNGLSSKPTYGPDVMNVHLIEVANIEGENDVLPAETRDPIRLRRLEPQRDYSTWRELRQFQEKALGNKKPSPAVAIAGLPKRIIGHFTKR